MPDTRSDADKAAGMIPVLWTDKIIRIPTLKRRAASEWRADIGLRLREMLGGGVPSTDPEALFAVLSKAPELVLDALLAYDQRGLLGSRETIDENVDDALIYGALLEVLKVAFPMIADLRGLISEVGTLLALQGTPGSPQEGPSLKESSTSGSSQSGDETPTN